MDIFLCTQCGARLQNAFAQPCACGFVTPIVDGVYQLTKDAPTSAAGAGLQWLGYDGVGENYEPAYFHDKDNDVIGNCDNLADFLGKGKVALDIGAGLGVSSIAMAQSGLQVVAADISQVMLAA
ncbi:MAG: hypothetical protein FWG38_00735, partial [Defluviitaleaceae bacterium]|nr:hypothetical protein [Defluviitaleaceae bacterium]